MQASATSFIEAPVDAVWAVISDVESWPEWLPTVTSVKRLTGAPAQGADFEVEQPRLPKAVWEIAIWDPPMRFDWVSRAIGVLTEGSHEVQAEGSGTRFTSTITQSGVLTSVAGLMYGRLIREYIQTEAASLKKRCENTV